MNQPRLHQEYVELSEKVRELGAESFRQVVPTCKRSSLQPGGCSLVVGCISGVELLDPFHPKVLI